MALVPLRAFALAEGVAAIGFAALCFASLRAILVLAYPTFSLLTALASMPIVESGSYISEQFRFGFNIGATPAFAAYALAFLLVASLAIEVIATRIDPVASPPIEKWFRLAIIAIAVGITTFYLVVFAIFGAGLSFASRFEWLNSLPRPVGQIHGVCAAFGIPVLFGLLGFYLKVFARGRWWMCAVALPVVALFATGDKFSGAILMIATLATGYGIGCLITRSLVRIRWYVIAGGLVVALGLMITLWLGYQRLGFDNFSEIIRDRVSLQGHVWFGIFDAFDGRPGISIAEIFGPDSVESPAGLNRLGYEVSRFDFVRIRHEQGISFTLGGPPTMLAAGGLVGGLFLYAASGLLFGGVVYLAVIATRNNDVIRFVLALVMYLAVCSATIMGRWDTLYGTVMIITVVLYVALTVAGRLAARARLSSR